jgi:hypothetical protein
MVKRTVCFISVARMSAESRDAHVPWVRDATKYRRLQRRSQAKPEGGEPWLSDQSLARLLVSSERMPQEKTTRMDTHVSAAGVGEECGAPGTRRHGLGDSTRQCSLKAFSNFAACLEYAILCAQTPNIALSNERFGCLEKPSFSRQEYEYFVSYATMRYRLKVGS